MTPQIIYKPLAKQIKRKGMLYTEKYREQDFAIYGAGSKRNAFLGYEVFQVQRHDGYEIAGNKILPAESYPADEAFGISAFFCTSLERAKLRLEQLKDLKKLRKTLS